MKPKKYRKIIEQSLRNNVREAFTAFCRLHWRERVRIAWLLVKGDSNLDKVAR